MTRISKPIGILYEHHSWLKPLFEEFTRRSIPFVRVNVAQHQFNPHESDAPFSLVINALSSVRGTSPGNFYAPSYLQHLENLGLPVINGTFAQHIETSKANQLAIFSSLALKFPKSRVANHLSQILPAAKSLRFPVLVKANIGGAGRGIVRFDSALALQKAIDLFQINLGVDHTALIQEYHVPKDGHIVRVETLNGKYHYAIKIYPEVSNGIPTLPSLYDVNTSGDTLFYLSGSPCRVSRVESFEPSDKIIADAQRIARTARLDAGGVEYLVDAATEETYFYDISTLSCFFEDARGIVGFDPCVSFVDYVESRLKPVYEEERLPLSLK